MRLFNSSLIIVCIPYAVKGPQIQQFASNEGGKRCCHRDKQTGKTTKNILRGTDADGFKRIDIETAIRNSLLEQNPPQQEPRPNGLSKARKSSSRRVTKMARRAVLSTRKEEQGCMKTDPNQFDDDAIECAIRISLMEQKKEKEKK
ncbi:Oidioi.mRNA.OKI2018_I69.chr2.g7189.t1.cds [Oikopleura dioica]|uniref:Oidioi.mRNA.OKI2018_I69.chr2.g7189.t1.cds n=1 Tax=Oikopleura dioica TaxID=34765 RepID=A0ABN7T610_OIKDI|nr:Oidioi.mRNA.OKI2018_I69.chr2.g7189.t1.cds [Oikopleura dioica]